MTTIHYSEPNYGRICR